MAPRIVVITYSISTSLGVIRSLGAAGYTVDCFFITLRVGESKTVALSKYVKKTTEFYGRKDDEVIEKLREEYKDRDRKCVLFPADDYCASLIDRYKDRLSTFFYMPYIVGKGQGAITYLMDKMVQSRLALECGLPVAREWSISLKNDIMISEDIVYPCYVKPLTSVSGRKTEMGKCSGEEELMKKLLLMKERDSDRLVLVQEYLDIEQEYAMSGVCADQEVVLPAIVKKHQIAQFRRGATLVGELVPIDEILPAKEAIYRFLRQIQYVGMFDLEIMRVGEKFYFGELNLRSGGPNYSYFASGVNLPDITVKAIIGEALGEVPEIQFHKVFLNDQDCWEDYLHGFITRKEFKSYFQHADILLLKGDDDSKPEKEFVKEIKWRYIKGIIRRIIRKNG